MMKLTEYLMSSAIKICDGAMGTQLEKRNLPMCGTNNLHHPETIIDVHKEYIKNGSRLIITNTLTMNRISMESQNLTESVFDVNLAGARLARQAFDGRNGYVLGDISSTGQLLEPLGTYSEQSFLDNYKEQAEALAEGGVDGFIIETVFDLKEALCALRACQAVADLPVIVSMTFATTARGCRTMMGNNAKEITKAVEDHGAAAVGANCGELTPEEIAIVIATMRQETNLPLMAQPNAGKPQLIDGKTVFNLAPEAFAKGIQDCIDAGASIVGGCCGTSPEHIGAVKRFLE